MWWSKSSKPGLVKASERAPQTPLARAARAQTLMRALEPRIMFDGAAVATAADAATKDTHTAHADAATSAAETHAADSNTHSTNDGHALVAAAAAVTPPQTPRHEILFVDTSVSDYQSLVAGVNADTEVVLITPGQDGLKVIADTLSGRNDIDAIHIVSHGDVGRIELGGSWIDSADISAHADALATIGKSLNDNGDILLYGCKIGADGSGAGFIQALANATGADVAASTDNTGAAHLGGNWLLEANTGKIETRAFEADAALASYDALLAAPTTENFDGVAVDGTGRSQGTTGAARVIDGWTFSLLNAGGTLDSGSYIDITRLTGDTSLADNGSDHAAFLNGTYTGSTGTQAAGVLKATTGEEFSFVSITVENGGGANTYRLVGYRDGSAVSGATQDFTAPAYGSNTVISVAGSAWQYVDEVRIVQQNGAADISIYIDDVTVTTAVAPNNTPAISNLNGDSAAWAGVGNTVTLDTSANASLTDTEFGALNSGNGNWSGGSLTVQRSTAVSADTFGFNTSGASFTVSGTSTSGNLQSGGQTFATYTGTSGVLTISFTSSGTAATTALVNDVARRITYRNDTPAGDASIRFTLSDGNTSTTADATVTSDTIYVTNTSDVSTIDPSNGVGLREAVAIAAADSTGTQTIIFSSALAGQTITLGSSLSIAENLTIDTDNASGVTIAGSGGISLGSGNTLSLSNGNADTATISTVLSNSGGLTKTGLGTFTLSGTNTFTGTTSITGGTLTLSGGNALDNSDAVSVSSGAELGVTSSETIGSLTGAGAVTIYTSQVLTINNTASGNFSGSLGGAGGLTISQISSNTNTLTLSGNNSGLTGAINLINYGRLSADGDSSIANTAAVTVNGNALLTLLTNQTIGSLASNAGTASIALGSFTLLTGSNNTSTTVSGVISGTGALTKQGSGTLTLDGANTYTGATTVSAGTLALSGGTALADSTAVTVASGATLSLAASETVGSLAGAGTVALSTNTFTAGGDNTSTTFSGGLTGSGGLIKAGSGTLTLSGSTSTYDTTTINAGTISVASDSNLGSGTVTLASGANLTITGANTIDNAITLTGNASVTNSANATLSGVISGSFTLTKTGASTLTLSGTNTYGATTVSAGTLKVAGDSNLGSGTVTLASGTTLSVTGATTIDNAIALSGNATVSNSAATTLSGNITGTGGLTKTGSAALTLTGTDSFSGATSVSAGSLLVNGALTATTSVTAASGSTLGGTGSITSNVTVSSGGTLSPGAGGAGTLTINGNLTMSAGSTLAVDINGSTAGSGYDQVIVNGTVSVSGTTLSATHGYTAGAGDAYRVIDNDSTDAITGTFSGLSQGSTLTAGGNSTVLTASYTGGTGNDFTLTAPTVPVVTAVSSSTANGTRKIGDTVSITVTFDQTVTVNTTGGTPTLLLETGTVDRQATYVSGSGTSTLTFTYTVQAGDLNADLDYASTSALALNGATIRDGLSNNATLTLTAPGASGSLGANKALVIDGVAPTASIVVTDTSLIAGETSLVTITFNEAVTGFTTADLTVANGVVSSLSSADGGITWTATLTPTASIADTTNLITLDNTGIADTAGNAGSGTTDSNNYAINTVRPTASIVVADTTLAAGETSLVTITFSEAVTGFTNADLTVANGTLTAVSSSDGGVTWTATLTPTASVTDATNLITLDNTGIANAAGNAGTGTTSSNNYAIDTARPTATIVVADNALAVGETSLVTITFSEAVTGFTNADLTVANGTLSAVSSSDGGITWTATLTPTASITDATNVITLDNTGVADAAGNAGAGTTDSNNYAIDNVRPTASIVVADNALAVGETSLVTITFSEAVTGFTNADLTIANGTLTAVSSSDGGITWTATLTPTASVTDATNLITLDNTGISDAAGNAGSGTTDSNNYAVDTVRPTASIVVADNALAIGETSLVTITFSEAVTGFTNADLTVANGTLSAVSSSDGGITWTATLTPTASVTDATNLITLDNTGIADAAGNAGTGTTDSNNYAIDSVRPTATIVVADNALAIGETSLVTITFSEAVTGFTNADLTVANGTLSAVSSSDGGVTWTATLTPTASTTDATNLITLDNTGIADAAGNAGNGTTDSNNYAIDTQRPTASIVVTDNALAIGETSLVTITFSEAVTGFTNADLTVANGTLSAVSSSDGGITWTATLTPTASTTDATNVITLDNTGIADTAGNAGTGTTDSNNYVIDNVRPTSSVTVAGTALVAGDTTTVTITFSEAVTGLTTADFAVANGALSNLSSSDGGITWTATLTPTAGVEDTTNIITLDNTGYTDTAGNAGTGTTDSNNYAMDTLHPILAGINGGGTFVENGAAIVIDGDATVVSAALDALNGSAGDYHDASLVVVRNGAAASTDSFGFTNGNGISLVGSNLVKNGQTIASFDTSSAGQLTITFSHANGEIPTHADANAILQQLTYRSTSEEPGTGVSLDVTFNDGLGANASAIAGLTLTSINDAPVNSVPASQDVNQDGSLIFNAGNGNQISVSDVDASTVEVTLTATHGVISLSGTNGLSFSSGDGVSDTTLVFSGSISDINNALNNLVFTPTAGYNGDAGIAMSSSDLGATGNGGAQIDNDSVGIFVHPINPIITAVATTNTGAHRIGDVISITVTFDQDVTVNTTNGTPTLLLETGNVDHSATYVSGSGSKTLTFNYTVQAGDVTTGLNYHDRAALTANGGSIVSATNNAAVLTLPDGVIAGGQVAVDGIAPTANITLEGSPSVYAKEASFVVQFSEPVNSVTAANFTLATSGSVSATVSNVIRVNDTTWRVVVNDIQGSGSLSLVPQAGAITDAVGNPVSSSSSAIFTAQLLPTPTTPATPTPVATPATIPAPAIGPATPLIVLAQNSAASASNGVLTSAEPLPLFSTVIAPIPSVVSTGLPSLAQFTSPGQASSVQVQAGVESFDSHATTVGSPRADTSSVSNAAIRTAPIAPASGFIDRNAMNATIQLRAQPDSGNFAFKPGAQIYVALPAGTFGAAAGNDVVVLARLANGEPLPSWLRFDSLTGTFSGKAPAGFKGELKIEIIIRDSKGHRASSSLKIDVDASASLLMPINSDALFAITDAPAAKPALTNQFARFGRQAWDAEANALLNRLG